jgi:hypothetical protein
VDFAGDIGTPNYGISFGGSSQYAMVGTCPIIALLPVAPAPLGNLQPILRCFGEPILGQSVDLQVRQATGNSGFAVLVIGTEQVGVGSPCAQFFNQQLPTKTLIAMVNSFGFGGANLTLPVLPAFMHSHFVVQGILPTTPVRLTNALRITLGGGL